MSSRLTLAIGPTAVAVLLCACGASEVPSAAVATEVAAEAFATQTAVLSLPTAMPPSRTAGDDESWYECFWGATELWLDAGEAFDEAIGLVEDDREEGCLAARDIADQLDRARTDWDRCPLPSSPTLQEFDRLSRESLANEGLASMYFILWCETPSKEVWETMLYFQPETIGLAQAAQDLLDEAE